MGNSYTPTDVYALVNEIVEQATGQKDIAVVDTTSFVSVGAQLVGTQIAAENTLNAISTVLARTIFSVRPYRGSLDIMRVSAERWGAIIRKIIPLPMDAEESQDMNTDINSDQLDDGKSIDMFKIKKPQVIQLSFWGTKKLQVHITRFRDQLSLAFTSEAEFMAFIDAVMTEFFNSLERMNEARTRGVLCNAIAGTYAMAETTPSCVVDLTAAFNEKFSTSYTREQLLTTYAEDFLKFFVAEIKKYSKRLKDSTAMYHANVLGKKILHHTPQSLQKFIAYEPYFIDSETQVLPTVYNDELLRIADYEGVNFWQDPATPEKIICKPTYLKEEDATTIDASDAVELDCVIGLLYDQEFMGVLPQFDYAATSPFNSAGGYWNQHYHYRFNNFTDYTENHILFIMGAGGEEPTETYTITYDVNGGEGTIEAVEVTAGESITLDDGSGITPPEGKEFKGWALSADAQNPTITSPYTPDRTRTIYAVYGDV